MEEPAWEEESELVIRSAIRRGAATYIVDIILRTDASIRFRVGETGADALRAVPSTPAAMRLMRGSGYNLASGRFFHTRPHDAEIQYVPHGASPR